MRILKIFGGSVLTLIIAFAVFLIIATINDYQPVARKIISTDKTKSIKKDTLEAVIWNIGYAGLGSDMDFFYDGGKNMRTSAKKTNQNLKAILKKLEYFEKHDFLLLQEIDVYSKRSYKINQKKIIENSIDLPYWYFAYNYKVDFIPLPLGNPLGRVNSGLLTGSRYKPDEVVRHTFSANYPWPTSIFMLDRCFMSCKYPLKNGDTLFIVNTHNTAYDDGNLRKQQMQQLNYWLKQKHNTHNHFIVGGDWNQLPPGINVNFFGTNPESKNYCPANIPSNFLPENWKFIYDTTYATNRGLNKPYNKNSYKTIIDYYLVSPHIEIINIQTHHLNFTNSDHEPVSIKFTIKKN